MSTQAGTIILAVRDLVPDPTATYGDATQDGGLFRAAVLYRWLNSLVQRAARTCGTIITDWTAIRQIANQPWYAVDDAFTTVTAAFTQQFRLDTITPTEEDVMWPGTSQATAGRAQAGYLRRQGSGLHFGIWPVPEDSDLATTLNGAITDAAATTPITLTSVLNALSFGYLMIDSEIVQYQVIDRTLNQISVISRGQCGTTAATHLNGATATFLGLWLKGSRRPAAITASTSVIELPADLMDVLEGALLSRCRTSEQEFGEGSRLMQEFDQVCRQIKADPSHKENRGIIPAFGDSWGGGLVLGGRVILP